MGQSARLPTGTIPSLSLLFRTPTPRPSRTMHSHRTMPLGLPTSISHAPPRFTNPVPLPQSQSSTTIRAATSLSTNSRSRMSGTRVLPPASTGMFRSARILSNIIWFSHTVSILNSIILTSTHRNNSSFLCYAIVILCFRLLEHYISSNLFVFFFYFFFFYTTRTLIFSLPFSVVFFLNLIQSPYYLKNKL